ncbi:hypothetical protein KIN20_033480 [Parelaphostrongylus tenuis]|uniref:Uncharacterized protein n=1 Tax=Parelaphostrongylus tenuis TaxID=148309 RepID=A0AAD5R855_PARTN|nr:hypothetical protein KIN20_033480 [Parelaphostrongylus tenuis]
MSPVAAVRRSPATPVRGSYSIADCRDDQRIKLLARDVHDSLPEHKQESFKRLMEILGTNAFEFRESPKRSYPGISPGYYRDLDDEGVSPRLGPQTSPRTAEHDEAGVYCADRTDVADMPESTSYDVNEGNQPVELSDNDEVIVNKCFLL